VEGEGAAGEASKRPGLELRSLQRQIHDSLWSQILRGELQPGEKISPAEVASDLGVSITPVRDAVNLLAAEGLVIIRPRRDTIVSPVRAEDVEELYEIRLMIEPPAAARAAEAATPDQVERISQLAARLEASPANAASTMDDPATYMDELSVDIDFHAEVIRAAGNQRLATLYDGLRAHLLIARTSYPTLQRARPHRHGEHQRIVDAIAAGDGDGARDAMVDHLTNARADALERIAEVVAKSAEPA
jgi:DNA-binding GntR family transcriptional regulator